MVSLGARAIVVLFLALLLSGAYACTVNVSNFQTLVKSNTDFYSNVAASPNTPIDVRTTFNITSYSGTDCPANITAYAVVTRYNSTTNAWESLTTLAQKSQTLAQDSYYFNWSAAFNTGTDSKYTQYKVEGIIVQGAIEVQRQTAYVDVQDNSCAGIKITPSNLTVNENTNGTINVQIQNTTNQSFTIGSLSLSVTSALLSSGSSNYASLVYPYTSQNATVSFYANSVTVNTPVSATLQISGNLGSTYCSASAIGVQTFTITVQNTGNNDYYYNGGTYYDPYYGTSGTCTDIELRANDVTLDESTQNKFMVSVKNNSTKRFEIIGVQTTSNGVELSNYYNEQYVFPGQISDIVLLAKTPAVSQDRTYENNFRITGQFSDGRSCSFTDSTAEIYNVIVKNTSDALTAPSCSALVISAPASVSIPTYGIVPFTISNGTNARADVYLEGVEAAPSALAIPAATSISRDASIVIREPSATLTIRASVSGCSSVTKTVTITNTASGDLAQTSMQVTSARDSNTDDLILTVTVNNPTARTFNGILAATTANGWVANDRSVSVAPGKNVFEVRVTPTTSASTPSGKVSFSANGDSVSATYGETNNGSLAGLFSFGGSISGIAILLLIILAVLLLVGLIANKGSGKRNDQTGQVWHEGESK